MEYITGLVFIIALPEKNIKMCNDFFNVNRIINQNNWRRHEKHSR